MYIDVILKEEDIHWPLFGYYHDTMCSMFNIKFTHFANLSFLVLFFIVSLFCHMNSFCV